MRVSPAMTSSLRAGPGAYRLSTHGSTAPSPLIQVPSARAASAAVDRTAPARDVPASTSDRGIAMKSVLTTAVLLRWLAARSQGNTPAPDLRPRSTPTTRRGRPPRRPRRCRHRRRAVYRKRDDAAGHGSRSVALPPSRRASSRRSAARASRTRRWPRSTSSRSVQMRRGKSGGSTWTRRAEKRTSTSRGKCRRLEAGWRQMAAGRRDIWTPTVAVDLDIGGRAYPPPSIVLDRAHFP